MDKLLEMTASIVEMQNLSNQLNAEAVAQSIQHVYSTLFELDTGASLFAKNTLPQAEDAQQTKQPSPRDSIHEDYVVCLECGRKMRHITKSHLKTHGLTTKEYKKKHGFRMRDSLACLHNQRERSEQTKRRGMSEQFIRANRLRRKNKVNEQHFGSNSNKTGQS